MNVDTHPFVAPPPDEDQWHPAPGYDGVIIDSRYPELVHKVQRLNEAFTTAAPTGDVMAEVTSKLDEAIKLLAEYEVPEAEWLAGRRLELADKGQAFTPAFEVTEWDRDHVVGTLSFNRYYVGGNNAAHGGAIGLVFDDILGRLAGTSGRGVSRTAYLNISYRQVTPIDKELTVIGRFEREEGRKRFIHGEILDGDVLCAEAEGLFIALLPGQP
ncbi:MAG TPA: PaaI family thioesterase [Jatrophihabitans sp.]|jgi:acyl-coenzyme A thioesterase PaaI-like protein